MFCVGLTGTLASGKSTVAKYFATLGAAVISADQIAKDLTGSKQPAFHEIIHHFGQEVLSVNGELDRRKLRQIIFQDINQRRWLEALLHPLIRAEIQRKIKDTTAIYTVIEIPLLTCREDYPYLNRILVVQATKSDQIKRFIARDNSTEQAALDILANQEKADHLADDYLINDGPLKQLYAHIECLHQKYLLDAYKMTQSVCLKSK